MILAPTTRLAFLATLILIPTPTTAQETNTNDKVFAGYLYGRPQKINFSLYTHLFHAFVVPNSDGSVKPSGSAPSRDLTAEAHKAGVKVVLSLGGWGWDDQFAALASNPESEDRHVKQVMEMVDDFDYDGIDFDWEYPDTESEIVNFERLARRFRVELDQLAQKKSRPMVLTMAVAANPGTISWLKTDFLLETLDWVNIMTYDYAGDWTNYAGHNSPLHASPRQPNGSPQLRRAHHALPARRPQAAPQPPRPRHPPLRPWLPRERSLRLHSERPQNPPPSRHLRQSRTPPETSKAGPVSGTTRSRPPGSSPPTSPPSSVTTTPSPSPSKPAGPWRKASEASSSGKSTRTASTTVQTPSSKPPASSGKPPTPRHLEPPSETRTPRTNLFEQEIHSMSPRRITPPFRSPGLTALLLVFVLFATATTLPASDLVTITAQTRDRYVPEGKEVDAIHGDFALANDQIIAVVARPSRGRHANLTVREVGGALIDLTRRDHESDQLSAFYPGAQLRDLRFAGVDVEAPKVVETASLENLFVKARRVTLRLAATPREQQPDVQVAYTLEDGWPYLLITTTFTNRSDRPLDVDLVDSARADRSFERSPDGPTNLYWVYDRHFGQAYGLMAEAHQVAATAGRSAMLRYQNAAGQAVATLAPGASYQLVRKVIPGAHLLQVQALAAQLTGQPSRLAQVHVTSAGAPVAAADVTLKQDDTTLGTGRTDPQGTLELHLAPGATTLTISEPSRGTQTLDLKADTRGPLNVDLPAPGLVVAQITDKAGKPTPCKVRFTGRDGTPDPDFGPDSADHAVKNLVYSPNGHFRRELPPGSYDVSISLGPEYDAVFTTLNVSQRPGNTPRRHARPHR